MNGINLPIVHPSFQRLRSNGKILHLLAAALIVIHAVSHFNQPGVNKIYFACLLIIALDIVILVIATNNRLSSLPKVNLFFRGIECIFFAGIGMEMMAGRNWFSGSSHIFLSLFYSYLFYCEKRLTKSEILGIYHTGISIPSLPTNKFLLWSNISDVNASYSSIQLVTAEKTVEFDLRENLEFGELDQIHEFCRHYLGKGR